MHQFIKGDTVDHCDGAAPVSQPVLLEGQV
jgi:hypothetical protein